MESTISSVYEDSVCENLSSKPGMETNLVPELPEEDEEWKRKNPFTIPPDIDIFALRNKERKKTKAERERMKTMKIHEKMTCSAKIKVKDKGLRKALQKEEEEEEEKSRKQATDDGRLKATLECLSGKMPIKKDYPLEKETLHDYINNRREIFLLEYAIAMKREKIRKMENLAKNEERKLEKAKYNLEKDIAVFDEFLKENHRSTIQAQKIAEKESAEKAKKITEIEAIGSRIMSLQSDITIFEDKLQEYKMYRDFLYELSPKEWQEDYEKKHRKQLKTATKDDKESASPADKGQDLTIGVNMSAAGETSSLLSTESLNSGLSFRTRPRHKSLLKSLTTENLPDNTKYFFRNSSEDRGSEICSDEDEKPELYFTDPQQLLSVLAEMEKQNFSYLCNYLDTERKKTAGTTWVEAAEERFLSWPRNQEQAQLKEALLTMKSTVTKLEQRAADLRLRVQEFSSHKADVQDEMLASLAIKVQEVYGHCIGKSKKGMKTVEMLAAIEKKLIDLLDDLEKVPPAKIAEIKKAKKREWRMR
ncbi:hypothetical protein ASZ78_012797 [Callipepla squamata]|uniref:DUF4200 domain-containing protein n=1 Tax=Callipepla squamata TaxID=9009 RepID=A0A226NAC8_CALSU|nr:hypothetical protein ASZ78_012797 [Callipepla squamata]